MESREQRYDGDADAALLLFASDEDEETDTACEVCGGAHDEHELLLCDAPDCPGACHVRCAGLAAVPAGDWFCRRCAEQRTQDELERPVASDTPPLLPFERFRFAGGS